MDPQAFVRAYYDALRAGEPLPPFFADHDDLVKVGIAETLVGREVEHGLRAQTETTTDWQVDSHALRATDAGDHGWFSDEVSMGWTDTERSIRFEFETRWSGTLVRTTDGDRPSDDPFDGWRFAGMHVSTARAL